MVKGVVSRAGNPGKEGVECTGRTKPQLHSINPAMKFAPPDHDTRSASRPELQQVMDLVRSYLVAGAEISETELFNKFSPPRRYLKGDVLRALRIVRRCYPTRCRLFLRNGIYVLAPVVPEVSP